MRPLLVAVVLLLALLQPSAEAATLRPFGILNGPVVRLSDLFDGLRAAGQQVLGPGPAPGEEITVPAAQLAVIAREFGVDWQPRSPGDQSVLERPGRALRRSEIMPALRRALFAAGAPASCRILLPGLNPPDVPPGAEVAVAVRQLEYEPATGDFSAVLSITAPGMHRVDVPVSGRAQRMAAIVVARHVLMPGTVVTAADLKGTDVPTGELASRVARLPAEAVGLELRRAIAAGDPLPMSDLFPPPLVRRAENVLIRLSAPGLALTEEGRALQSGASGASVRVLNPVSHAVLQATVTGPGEVSIVLGSLPISGPRTGPGTAYAEYATQ